ncbi:hypothetical protein, partial [Bordetella pertussis]|uniref:hypothetical protein n=1 Tax=Bordetella pertussis TaxID=520 RepID=UPI001C9E9D81
RIGAGLGAGRAACGRQQQGGQEMSAHEEASTRRRAGRRGRGTRVPQSCIMAKAAPRRAAPGPLAVLSRFRLCGVFSAPRRAARNPRRNYD